MGPEHLIKQCETYTNAIVAFSAAQALAYAYAFGNNEFFNCLVKSASHLAAGLVLLFLVAMILFLVVIHYCRKAVRAHAGEFAAAVDRIYFAKMAAVVLFSLVPMSLTFAYGVMLPSVKMECNRIISGATPQGAQQAR